MQTGTHYTKRSMAEVEDRLRLLLAAGGFRIVEERERELQFTHGTMLTHSAPLLPKRGCVRMRPEAEGTQVDFEIDLATFPKYWIGFIGLLFGWLIFPAVIAYRAIFVHPRLQMENLIAGL